MRLAATGTHPWSPWQEQRIIDTPHYRRREEWLKYVAWRNNTFSLHVHVGVRGADRAIAVCDRLRALLPDLLALSANSPFLDGRDSGLHSARTQIFTKSFPRCGVHEPFGDWDTYADFVDFLVDVNSIVEHTQLWWSVRPHHDFGTVEFRICDAQTTRRGLDRARRPDRGLHRPGGARLRRGRAAGAGPGRATSRRTSGGRSATGMDGTHDRLRARRGVRRRGAIPDRLLAWTAPARASTRASSRRCRTRTAPSASARAAADMRREAFAAEVDADAARPTRARGWRRERATRRIRRGA